MVHVSGLGLVVALLSVAPTEVWQIHPGEGVTISGAVIDEASGEPISGASVRLRVEGQPLLRAETDEAGRFSFESAVRMGRAEVQVWAEGFLPGSQRFRIDCDPEGTQPSSCERGVDLYLHSAQGLFAPSASMCVVEGKVLGTDGRPVRGARVSLEGRAGVVESDEEGRFAVSEVRSGLRIARAVTIGMYMDERLILVSCRSEGAPSTANFRLSPQMLNLRTIIVGIRRR